MGQKSLTINDLQAQTLGDQIVDVSRDKQFVLLGDSDHSKAELFLKALEPQTVEGMRKAGIKDVFLEQPRDAQFYMDDYYAGKLKYKGKKGDEALYALFEGTERSMASAEDNAKLAKAYPDFIKNAKASGIKVHFADVSGDEIDRQEKARENFPHAAEMRPIFARQYEVPLPQFEAEQVERAKKDPQFLERYQAYSSARLAQRFEYDGRIAGEMKKAVTESGGKAAVMFGENHFTNSDGFHKVLGDDAASISVRGNQSEIEGFEGKAYAMQNVHYTGFKQNDGSKIEASGRVKVTPLSVEKAPPSVETPPPSVEKPSPSVETTPQDPMEKAKEQAMKALSGKTPNFACTSAAQGNKTPMNVTGVQPQENACQI